MSGGGGKGGSQSTEASLPPWMNNAMQHNLGRAQQASEIGHQAYYGPSVAALNDMQRAGIQNANNAASAFGLAAPSDPLSGLPVAQDFGNGVMGHSAQPIFEGAVHDWNRHNPTQTDQYSQLFVPQMETSPNWPQQPAGQPAMGQAQPAIGLQDQAFWGAPPPPGPNQGHTSQGMLGGSAYAPAMPQMGSLMHMKGGPK